MSQPGSPSPLARRASWLGALAVTAILTLACEDSAGPLPTPAAPTSPPASSFYNPRPERTDYVVGMVDRLPDAGGVTWTSSNPDVLAVLPGGRFLARGAGQADLIGSGASQETRVTLSVTSPYDRTGEPRLTGLEIAGLVDFLLLHERVGVVEGAVVAYGVYDQEVFREVAATLESLDPDVLTVEKDGTIRVNAAGEVTITASFGELLVAQQIRVQTWEELSASFSGGGDEVGAPECGLLAFTPLGSSPALLVEGMTAPLLAYELCRTNGAMRRVHHSDFVSSDPEVVRFEPEGLVVAGRPGVASYRSHTWGPDGPGFPLKVLPAFEFTAEALSLRSYQDRPDDYEGPQIHVVYAVPENVADRGLDLSGKLENSVAALQDWIRQAIGYELNLDTHGGRLDITFVRLLTPLGGEATTVSGLRDGLERALGIQEDKKYLVFAPTRLGWPGAARDPMGAVFLDPYLGASRGEIFDQFAPLESEFGITRTETSALRQLLHTFGAVPECAPNRGRGNSVNDSADDLMASGSGSRIDVGRDDYFGHGREDCLDTANSPYWRQVANVTTDSSAASRAEEGHGGTVPITLEQQIRSLMASDRYLRHALTR